MTEKIRVVVIDDHPLFREGVVNTLRNQPDFVVVGEGISSDDAVRLVLEYLPEAILLDISIPGSGLTAIPQIASKCPFTKIVMLTASDEEDDVMTALKAGAHGYILKGVLGSELSHIIRTVVGGGSYVTPALAASLLAEMTNKSTQKAEPNPLDALTEREHQILELVAKGLSNKEIAVELVLAEKTIKHYMTNVLQKLHVRNRVEAALLSKRISFKL